MHTNLTLLPNRTRVESTDLAACQQTRCLAALAIGDDESARREFAAMIAGVDNYAAASDRRLLSGHAWLLAAILDRDEAELADAAGNLTTNLLDHITAQRFREQSRDLIDWPTTAALAVATRRGMRVPTDLPACAVDLIAPDWVD